MKRRGNRLLLLLCLGTARASGQCIVDNPGGSKTNTNRPLDADVPPATYSPIALVNKALPHWLCFTAGYRARAEGYSAGNLQAGNSDNYVLTRFRLGAAIRPASWLRSYFELQDATAFGKSGPLAPPYQSTWDLRRAYIDLGDAAASHFGLRVGRQDLSFGHQRLIGTSYWRNVSRGWDAVLAEINEKRARVSVFSASPVVPGDNGLSHHTAGNNLHGVYAVLKPFNGESTLEPYALWKVARGLRTESGEAAKLDHKTLGLRWAGVASKLDYDAEIAAQTGTIGSDRVRAWAWSAVTGYTLEGWRRARVSLRLDYASGDKDPHDGVHQTFDQLFPNVHDHRGLADLVGWQNVMAMRWALRVPVRHNWLIAGAYNDWWLAQAMDAFYSAQGTVVAVDRTGKSGRHIGREYDLQTSYRPNRHLEFAGGIGYLRSGEFALRTHHAASYSYPFAMVYYNVF